MFWPLIVFVDHSCSGSTEGFKSSGSQRAPGKTGKSENHSLDTICLNITYAVRYYNMGSYQFVIYIVYYIHYILCITFKIRNLVGDMRRETANLMSKCLSDSGLWAQLLAVFRLTTPSWSDADESAAQALEGGGTVGIVFSHGRFLCLAFSFLFSLGFEALFKFLKPPECSFVFHFFKSILQWTSIFPIIVLFDPSYVLFCCISDCFAVSRCLFSGGLSTELIAAVIVAVAAGGHGYLKLRTQEAWKATVFNGFTTRRHCYLQHNF